MSAPRLTIGIPTLDRPEMLQRAIDSCLRQTTPVRVVVADQGRSEGTAKVMERYLWHPNVCHAFSRATNLWENWKEAAQLCDFGRSSDEPSTEFFAWCQDDDVVGRGYAARIINAFDKFPDALTWLARLHNGIDEKFAAWFSGNGPWVPMRLLDGLPDCHLGELLVPSMYLTSWSLSPARAFRCGEAFDWALEQMPSDADLFEERLLLALMGSRGKFVADPVIAGYWIHHGGNESYKQHHDQARQEQVATRLLDDLMDTTDWRDVFAQWCLVMPAVNVIQWMQGMEKSESRHREDLIRIMQGSLVGRCEMLKVDPSAEPAPEVADPVLACA